MLMITATFCVSDKEGQLTHEGGQTLTLSWLWWGGLNRSQSMIVSQASLRECLRSCAFAVMRT